jgi:hypothetical protein
MHCGIYLVYPNIPMHSQQGQLRVLLQVNLNRYNAALALRQDVHSGLVGAALWLVMFNVQHI